MNSRHAPAPPDQVRRSNIELGDTLTSERARLVRLCTRATGDPDAAEDLAQEALFEAWRAAHKLPEGVSAEERGRWLSVIARNVCLRWAHREALSPAPVPCMGCGRSIRFWLEPLDADRPHAVEARARCGACGANVQTYHAWLALCTPEGRRFYREHERIRRIGEHVVAVGPAGGPALVTCYESVAGAARFEVVSALDTLRVLAVHGTSAPDDTGDNGGVDKAAHR